MAALIKAGLAYNEQSYNKIPFSANKDEYKIYSALFVVSGYLTLEALMDHIELH